MGVRDGPDVVDKRKSCTCRESYPWAVQRKARRYTDSAKQGISSAKFESETECEDADIFIAFQRIMKRCVSRRSYIL